jgi:MFS family permease
MFQTARRPSRASSIALAVIVTCQLMVVLDATVVNIALVPIQHSLHFSSAGLSWVIDAYSLAFGGLLLLGGRAGDVFGRRRMLMIGLTIFTTASLFGGLSPSATWLLVTRAIQGVGAALAAPSTLSLISATFEEGPERNRALGIFSAVSAGGGSLGLILGGALTSWVSWRHQRQPLLPMRLLTDRLRGPAYLTMLLVPAVMYGVFFFVSQYLEGDLHFSAIQSGLAFMPLTGIIFASSRVTPRLIARIGARPILLFGLTTLTVASVWISQATPAQGYVGGLLGPLMLFGVGAGSCFLPLSVTILAGVPRHDAGAASGMLQTMQQTGAALGVAALTSVASAHGRSDALLTGAGITVVALAVAYLAIRPARQTARPSAEESAEALMPLLLSE